MKQRNDRWPSLLALAAGFLTAAGHASAQVVTSITPDVALSRTTSTTVMPAGAIQNIAGGVQMGGNLFHSFSGFNLGAGDTARWTAAAPLSVSNVINRVTGGSVSNINGTVDLTFLPNANFFFLNPAGVIFGDGFSANLAGAFHISTANQISFADGGSFSATTPEGSTFTSAAPESFGFLAPPGSDISFTSAAQRTISFGSEGSGQSFALSARNVSLANTDIRAESRNIALTAVGERSVTIPIALREGRQLAGVTTLANSSLVTQPNVLPSPGAYTGDIVVSTGDLAISGTQPAPFRSGFTTLNTLSTPMGQITIHADTISMSGSSILNAGTGSDTAAGPINIYVGSLMTLTGTGIAGDPGTSIGSPASAGGRGGDLNIFGSSALLHLNGAGVAAFSSGAGNAGDIAIQVKKVVLDNGGFISGGAQSSGDGGSISIKADSLRLLSSNGGISFIAEGTSGTGRGGNIKIEAKQIDLQGASGTNLVTIDASANASGAGGSINIRSDSINVVNGFINAVTTSTGNGGSIVIDAADVNLGQNAGILNTAAGDIAGANAGAAGAIDIVAKRLTLRDGGTITADTLSAGPAGAIRLSIADTLRIEGRTGVVSTVQVSSQGAGKGGTLAISASNIVMQADNGGFARIASTTSKGGLGGAVSIVADNIAMAGSSAIALNSEVAGGDAGTLSLTANSVTMADGAAILGDTLGAGKGASLRLAVRDGLSLANSSSIAAATKGAGAAGSIQLSAGTLRVDTGSFIEAGSFAVGRGGDVTVSASQVRLSNRGRIASVAQADGAGGALLLQGLSGARADSITLDSGGTIDASTAGVGQGTAGDVTIRADRLSLNNSSVTTSTTGVRSGAAGSITLDVVDLRLANTSFVQSASSVSSVGAAGAIRIGSAARKARTVSVMSGSQIETTSANATTAGAISIYSEDVLVDGTGTAIASENLGIGPQAGAAGSILIDVDPITISNGGKITTNSVAGAAGDIVLRLPSNGLLWLSGETPGVITTSSGIGAGGRITISDPLAIISNGGQILALGNAGGANVNLSSRYFIRSADRSNTLLVDGTLILDSQVEDVSQGTQRVEIPFLDTMRVLEGQCRVVRALGQTSQFSTPKFGPYGAPVASSFGANKIAALARIDRCY